MRHMAILTVFAVILCGCASSPTSPAVRDIDQQAGALSQEVVDMIGVHRLWGEWRLFFDETHTRVDAIPVRSGRFHLNVLKFLEEYCKNCLQITSIHNNGDGTIDLTVRITHPFPGLPQYTGFDVKGIIMFNGSHAVPWWSLAGVYPGGEPPPDNNWFHVSWKEVGDPELLNPDGHTVLWSPWWPSGSNMPVFNYWPGKYSAGTPTANINAYINFYTDEERHMFRCDGSVQRTYHIWLPPGPVVAGYAIDACWEPPTTTPVTDPLNDFPISANQPEAYYFRFVLNNGEPITEKCCGWDYDYDCSKFRYEYRRWWGEELNLAIVALPWWPEWITGGGQLYVCDQTPPEGEQWRTDMGWYAVTNYYEGDGTYRGVAAIYREYYPPWGIESVAYDVFDFTIDME